MPRDGEVDYSVMSRAQLEEALTRIDAAAYPDNTARLLGELQKRSRSEPGYTVPATLTEALRGSPAPDLDQRSRGLQVSMKGTRATQVVALALSAMVLAALARTLAFHPENVFVNGAPAGLAGRVGIAAFATLLCGAIVWFCFRFKRVTLVRDGVRIDGWRDSVTVPDARIWDVEWVQRPGGDRTPIARLWLIGDSPFGDGILFVPRSAEHLAVLGKLRQREFRPSSSFMGTPDAQ